MKRTLCLLEVGIRPDGIDGAPAGRDLENGGCAGGGGEGCPDVDIGGIVVALDLEVGGFELEGRESAGKEEEKDSEETVGSLDCAGSKWVGMVGGGEAEEPDGSGF